MFSVLSYRVPGMTNKSSVDTTLLNKFLVILLSFGIEVHGFQEESQCEVVQKLIFIVSVT